MNEIWLPIKGYEGLYVVSDKGQVRTLRFTNTQGINERCRDRIMKVQTDRWGYLTIGLRDKDNVKKRFFVHRLVAIAHIENENNLPQVNHKDLDKTNNSVNNLEWVSALQNMTHLYWNKIIDTEKNLKGISVAKINKEGNVIAIYQTIKEAAERNKMRPVILGRILSGKYKREFESRYIYVSDEIIKMYTFE